MIETFNTLYGSFLVEAAGAFRVTSSTASFNTLYGSFLVEADKPAQHTSTACELSIPSTGRSWLKHSNRCVAWSGGSSFNTLYGSFLVEAQTRGAAGSQKLLFQYPLRVVPG